MTRRLNWGCGCETLPGWVNADLIAAAGVDVVHDIRHGLPFRDGTFAYIVSIHALGTLSYLSLVPALTELRRVLRPDGVLRLGLPDLDRGIHAYLSGDHGYFYVPDADASSLGGKLCVQATWYGSVRTPFTYDFIEELALRAGFSAVWRAAAGETRTPHADIVMLDNRERESLFVEAIR